MAFHSLHADLRPTPRHLSEGTCAIVMFVTVHGPHADRDLTQCQFPSHAVGLLCHRGIRLVLVSKSPADHLREVQRELDIREPFICGGGAALHVPSRYFGTVDASHIVGARAWERFHFNPPDRAAGVNLVCDLFLADGWSDVLTIGIGCDCDDYGMLAAVDIPIVVRDAVNDQSALLRHVPGAYLTDATGTDGWIEALIGP